jgi:hypothetical protein
LRRRGVTLTAKTVKVTGIKGHEELHAHVDEKGAGTVWVRALEVDEKGEAERGVQVPLTPADAKSFATQLQALVEYATSK